MGRRIWCWPKYIVFIVAVVGRLIAAYSIPEADIVLLGPGAGFRVSIPGI